MPDNPDARCGVCWGQGFCVECDGGGELPITGGRCPVCSGWGSCPRCHGSGDEPDGEAA